ncbi:MAG: glycosyltransferase [Syntrophales bacterium LBB04]|nr:glycosyltransferase [Syntrophales bacterium LBB04]
MIGHLLQKFTPRRLLALCMAVVHRFAVLSYAQEGEDLVLATIFKGKNDGFYVDVGAHHPKRFSNTYFFYRLGWRGVNIDAMPGSMELFRKVRKRDVNLEVPIAEKHEILKYYIFNDLALNTFSKELAEQRDGEEGYAIIDTRELQTRRLSEVMEEAIPPGQQIDFMSVDVEGLDLNVLRSNDWEKFRPTILTIEDTESTNLKQAEETELYRYVVSLDYQLVAKTVHALFFEDQHGSPKQISRTTDPATVYVLLPVHNRRDITCRFLECLRLQTWQNYHVVLLDDGSTDGTGEAAAQLINRLTIVRGKGSWWWAGALQEGFRWLKANQCQPADVVLIINDDTTFEKDFLEIGVDILSRRRSTLLLAQCYSMESGKLLDAGIHADWNWLTFEHATNPDEINCFSTMGLFLYFEDFKRIGGFHPRLLPHFTSDYEFTIRAHRKGLSLMTDPKLKLCLDEKTTWNRPSDGMPFVPLLKTLFSKKSPVNPWVWIAFIALACPWRWKLPNWLRICLNTWYLLAPYFPKQFTRCVNIVLFVLISPIVRKRVAKQQQEAKERKGSLSDL